jgi:hypothetical protein
MLGKTQDMRLNQCIALRKPPSCSRVFWCCTIFCILALSGRSTMSQKEHQKCPNVFTSEPSKLMVDLPISAFHSGLDLNVECLNGDFVRFCTSDRLTSRQARVRSAHGASATEHLSPLCGSPSGRLQSPRFLLLGSVLCHALYADLEPNQLSLM